MCVPVSLAFTCCSETCSVFVATCCCSACSVLTAISRCYLSGSTKSATFWGEADALAGEEQEHRSGGQIDGLAPQLLTHQLVVAVISLRAKQEDGSAPSASAVGKRKFPAGIA